jgi:autotransporter-associated beta strand protein
MKFKNAFAVCVGLIVLNFCTHGGAQIPAFPGALGFGANATGGRNGTVYHVTTLADSGTGSFRDAVSQPNRIVVFDVGGTITLASAVTCANDLTIAGQTAPGGGIAIIGHEVSFSVRTNEIVRFLRIRPGSIASSTEDGIDMGDGTNLIFDHVPIEFAPYNNIDAHGNYTAGNQITIQNSILADPIGQQFNAHTEASNNTFSWFYNIFSSGHDRNPLAKVNTIFINNVVYNYQSGYTVANTGGIFSHDIVNNYFITGPATTSASDDFFQFDSGQSVYASGNLLDSADDGTLSGSATAPDGVTVLSSPWSSLTANIPTASATAAFRNDLSLSGAQPLDQVDQLVFNDVSSVGTSGQGGGLWTTQTATGLGNNGYGTINGGIPPTDSDQDGMPDFWDETVGLSPYGDEAMTIAADGYANIEHYLNWLAAPHALTVTNTPVSVDLSQYTGGYTNASPVYSVNNASNGVVTLTSSHIAQFTPTANFFGLASFQFSVAASDGSAYTNTVTVAVAPVAITQPSNLTWYGDSVSNLWAVGSGTNWFNGTNLVTFADGDTVTFDDTGSSTPAINLSGPLVAETVNVLASQNYTFAGSGSLAGSTVLFKVGTGQLNIYTTNSYSGGTLIQEGVVQLGDGTNFSGSIAGNITNNDTLIFDNPGTVSASASINGSGTFTKSGPGSLTLTGTQTYTNLTTINAGTLQFSSTIPPGNIVDNGTLVLAPSASVTCSNLISGSGAVNLNSSALLTMTGTNTYTGGTTNVSGSTFIANNSSLGSGPVTYTGGFVFVGNGAFVTNDFIVPTSTSDLMMAGTNNNTGTWAGNVVGLGSGAQWRPGSDGGSLTFVGNAILGSHIFIVPRGTVIFASNAVVSSSVSGYLGRDSSAAKRSLNVTVENNASVAMAGCSMGGGKTGGSITITIQNNGSLSLGTSVDLHDIINAAAISTVRLNGGSFTVGGFTKTESSYTNLIVFNSGHLIAAANNTAFLPALSASTNIVQAGGAIIDDGGFAITIAAPLIHDASLGTTLDGGLTKLGAGTLTLGATETYSGSTTVSNGTLALSASGSLANAANLTIAAGVFDASAAGGFTLGSGRKLSGNGTANGNVTINSGATLAPGISIGTLTFNNALVLSAGSTNVFAISQSPLTNSAADVLGAVTLGGTLIVTNAGSTALAAGDSFNLVNAASYNGTFANVILPALNSGLAWNTNALNTNGVISIVSTAPPTPPLLQSISLAGNNFAFTGTGGATGATFYVLGSTNINTPLTNWTRLLTNQFDNNGNFNFTNPAVTNSPQQFYLLQLQ